MDIATREPTPLELFRQERGWSQAQLAEHLGVNQSTVSRIETGAAEPSKPVRRLIGILLSEAAQ